MCGFPCRILFHFHHHHHFHPPQQQFAKLFAQFRKRTQRHTRHEVLNISPFARNAHLTSKTHLTTHVYCAESERRVAAPRRVIRRDGKETICTDARSCAMSARAPWLCPIMYQIIECAEHTSITPLHAAYPPQSVRQSAHTQRWKSCITARVHALHG